MNISRFETNKRMSRAVIHNNTLYLCGQVCADASAGITEQTQTMLDKVELLLNKYVLSLYSQSFSSSTELLCISFVCVVIIK